MKVRAKNSLPIPRGSKVRTPSFGVKKGGAIGKAKKPKVGIAIMIAVGKPKRGMRNG